MKDIRSRNNWIIDAVLFTGFIIMFFLDLTGVELHQWLGVAGGALALYHLLVHWDWIEAVSQRFFGRTTRQARLYYLVDAGILSGMVSILLSGLAISTWLTLPLGDEAAWIDFHETVSEVTLLLLVFKIAIHWRWTVKTVRRMVSPSVAPATGKPAVQHVTASGKLGRQDFLKLMGVVSAAAALALINATGPTGEYEAQASNTQAESNTSSQVQSSDTQIEVGNVSCISRCRKGRSCTYPGECHQYVDMNGNGRCDQGECT